MIGSECRRTQRVRCRVIVERLGPTIDLSPGGLRLLMGRPPAPGTELRLAFQLPEAADTLQCHGCVIHVSPSEIDDDLAEVGVEFQRMMSRDCRAVADYVASRVGPDSDQLD